MHYSKTYGYGYNSKNTSFKKSGLSKYASYGNLIKSQDNLLEKRRLKEENWKLKNLSNSLNEENKKLREKINRRFNILEQCNIKHFHIVNYNSNIEKIKEDITKIGDELQSIITENTELTSKLSKQVNKKITINHTPAQFTEALIVKSESKKLFEQSNEKKTIDDMNSEISELTVALQSLTTKNTSYKDQIASYKTIVESQKKKDFQISKEACIGVFSQIESLKIGKKLSVEEGSSDCSELS